VETWIRSAPRFPADLCQLDRRGHVGYSFAFFLFSESIGAKHSSQSPEEALAPDTTHSLELGTDNHSLNHREAAAGCGGLAKTLSLESCSDFVMLRRRIR